MPAVANPIARHASHLGRVLRASDVVETPDGLRLCGAECAQCGTRIFPAAGVCPSCNSEQMQRLVLAGEGTLYAFSTVHIAPAAWETPYTIGYVDLPENVRVFGKVAASVELKPDARVSVRIEPATVTAATAGTAAAGGPTWQYWFAPL
jgi:uncharacterized OB-fold protein